MRAFCYVHFRSRDKDGGYTIQFAVTENPMLHTNITALCLMERELLPIEVLHCRDEIRIFDLFGSRNLDLDPNSTRSRWRYRMCKYELPTSMLSKVIV